MVRKIKIDFLSLVITVIYFLSSFFAYSQSTVFTNGVKDKRVEVFAFTNATLFVDFKTKIENATLVLKEGKVILSGANILIPPGAIVEDLAGAYIYPSFIDLYTDFGMPEIHKGIASRYPQYYSNKKGPYSWNQAIKPETNAFEFYNYNDSKANEWRKLGFGAVLSHYKDGIARGTSTFNLLSDGQPTEMMLISKAASHFSFSKGTSNQEYPSSLIGAIALIRQTFLDADWYSKNQNKETNLSLQAINENKKLPFIFETNNNQSFLRADKIGDEFENQFIIKGSGDEYQLIDQIAASQAKIILPINFPKPFDIDDPFIANQVSWSQLKHWEMAALNPGRLEKENVKFSLTLADMADKKDFLKNLRLAVQYGLSETTALKALTYEPASFIGQEKILGQLRPGFLANFIIVSGNVFDESSVIYENWVKGKKHVILEKPSFDSRGKYDLSIGQEPTFKLIIKGKKEAPEISIISLDSLINKASGSFSGFDINISFAVKRDSLINDFRLSGNYKNKQFEGFGNGPGGKIFNWRAVFSDTVLLTKPISKPKIDSLILKAKVKYPFIGYGFDKKPVSQTILIKNATVFTSSDLGVLSNTDVLVKNGKIFKIGKGLGSVDAVSIEGTGKFLTAGIIDEHSHIAAAGGLNEVGKSVTSEVRMGDVIDPTDINIYRQLAGGVTAVQVLHGSANCIGGQSGLIKLKWGETAENMKISNADGFIKFALGENVKQSNWGDNYVLRYPQTRMGVEQIFADAFVRAKAYESEWKSYFDSKGKLTQPRRNLELEAIVEILNKKRFITCHSYVQSEVNMLIHLADSLGFKVNTFTHILDGYKIADKIAKHGANGSTFSDWWTYKMEVVDAIPQNAFLLSKNGINTCINSDDPEMGRRLNQEAAKSIKYAKMDSLEAWKMVTLNPAKALHLEKRMGSVAEGKDADLVLWSKNPLSIDAIVDYTLVDGVIYFDRFESETMKKELDKEKNRLIQKTILAKRGGEIVQPISIKKAKNYDCEAFDSDYADE